MVTGTGLFILLYMIDSSLNGIEHILIYYKQKMNRNLRLRACINMYIVCAVILDAMMVTIIACLFLLLSVLNRPFEKLKE